MRDKTEELRQAVEEWQHRADAALAASAAAALAAAEASPCAAAALSPRPPSGPPRRPSLSRSGAARPSAELSPAAVAAAAVAVAAPPPGRRPLLTTGFLDGTHPIVDAYELKVPPPAQRHRSRIHPPMVPAPCQTCESCCTVQRRYDISGVCSHMRDVSSGRDGTSWKVSANTMVLAASRPICR